MKEERIIYTASPRRKLPLKAVVLVLCLALFGGVAVGGTVAYLSDSDAAQNTFTMGEVTLTLNETQAEYKMIPGVPIHKDPSVTVGAESSDCWVFAKLVPDADFADYLVFAPNTADWQQLPTTDGSTLLYMLVDTDAEKTAAHGVLAGGFVTPLYGLLGLIPDFDLCYRVWRKIRNCILIMDLGSFCSVWKFNRIV